MFRSLGGIQRPGSRYGVAEARVKLAWICGAIVSVFCLLAFAAGPAAAAGVTATTDPASNVTSQSAQLNGEYDNSAGATGRRGGFSGSDVYAGRELGRHRLLPGL
jgi:hypothetical protein